MAISLRSTLLSFVSAGLLAGCAMTLYPDTVHRRCGHTAYAAKVDAFVVVDACPR
jgi:hypothetical protein